jgi:hypothetical protein
MVTAGLEEGLGPAEDLLQACEGLQNEFHGKCLNVATGGYNRFNRLKFRTG